MSYNDDISLDDGLLAHDLKSTSGNATPGAPGQTSIFKPKPTKAGEIYENRVFIPSIEPHLQLGFEIYPQGYRTFYIKVHGHYIESFDGEKKRTQFVLCKKSQNKYVREGVLKNSRVSQFEDDRCPSCELVSGLWDAWDAAWAQAGYPSKEARKALSQDAYRQIAKDPAILEARNAATSAMPKVKYLLPVVDLEEQAYQIKWMYGPEKVFEALVELVKAGVKFYSLAPDPHAPGVEGAVIGREIKITRDTRNGLRQAEYRVIDNRASLAFSPEIIDYLRAPESFPSAIDTLTIMEYAEHAALLSAPTGAVMDTDQSPIIGGDDVPPQEEPPAALPPRAAAPARAPAMAAPAAPRPATAPPARPAAAPKAPAPAVAPAVAAPRTAVPSAPQAAAPVGPRRPSAPTPAAPGAPASPRKAW